VKIRIRDNSLRLRLTRSEVEAMREVGTVTSNTGFPGARQFRYSLQSSPASDNPAAFYAENEITVRIPETTLLAWVTTEQVSITGDQVLDDGQVLSILVEKDFACLAPRDGEDESDMFAHPDNDTGAC